MVHVHVDYRRFGKRIYIPLPKQQVCELRLMNVHLCKLIVTVNLQARESVLSKLITKHNHSITEEQLQTLAM